MRNSPYKVAFARIAGRTHVASSTPCQDFAGARQSAGMACVALADGAGSRKRSDVGAEAVVKVMLRMLPEQFDALYKMCEEGGTAAQHHILSRLKKTLHRKAAQQSCQVDSFASTLLFAAHKENRFIAGHIGDGVIACIDAASSAYTLSLPENGEYANTTVFVTDNKAVDCFRIYHGEAAAAPLGFILMSDGCAESLYNKLTRKPAAAVIKLHDWNMALPKKKMQEILEANLEQSFSKKSTDDCALALLSLIHRQSNQAALENPAALANT